jgi:hypothetical protein
MSDDRLVILEQRMDHLGGTVMRVDDKLDSIASTLQSLVRIEERQISTNEKLGDVTKGAQDRETRLRAVEAAIPENLDKRLVSIETKMPGLVESRKWVVMGVLAGIGMIGAAVVHTVIK